MGKKRITKKELKEDTFILFVRLIEGFILKNKSRVISWGVIIGLTIILLLIVIPILRQWEEESLKMLYKAQEIYRRASKEEDLKEAKEKFEEILRRYPQTSSRKIALVYLGNCEYRLGRYDKALLRFKRFLNRYPRHFLAPFVKEALANTYEQKGDYNMAISIYEGLIKESSKDINTAYIWLSIGRCYRSLKNYKEAKKVYEKVLKDFPQSAFIEEARFQIERLKEVEKVKEKG